MSTDTRHDEPRGDVCGATDKGRVCRATPTHEVEVNAPGRGNVTDRRCADCAEQARGRAYVRDVRPITLDADAEEVARAIYEYCKYTCATRDKIGYTPAVRVDEDDERLVVALGSVLYISNRSEWMRAGVLLEDAPSYFKTEEDEWLEATSTCVRETIKDKDGRTWSLPTEDIAETLRDGSFLDEEGAK